MILLNIEPDLCNEFFPNEADNKAPNYWKSQPDKVLRATLMLIGKSILDAFTFMPSMDKIKHRLSSSSIPAPKTKQGDTGPGPLCSPASTG